MEIPNAGDHVDVEKCGYLLKLSLRFPYMQQWKRRYFILTKEKLYVYDKSDSRGTEKNSGLIDLKYFDYVTEADQKDCRKAAHSFLITSKDRTFLDPGRYLLSADSKEEKIDWMEQLRKAMEYTRNNNKPTKVCCLKSNSQKIKQDTQKEVSEELSQTANKEVMNLLCSPSFPTKEFQTRINPSFENGLPAIQTKPLKCINRTRAKGPAGRRAPRNRHTMQARTNSLILQKPFVNGDGGYRSPRIVGLIEKSGRKLHNESYPSLAYFYSDDEDSGDENVNACTIKSLSSQNLNFNLVSTSQRSSVHFAKEVPNTINPSSVLEEGDTHLFPGDTLNYSDLAKSFGRTSGRTSPTMDALDDLLMNQSIQQVELVEDRSSDANDSDSNTYLVNSNQKADDSVSTSTAIGFEGNYPELDDFSSELKHLHKHISSIDIRTTSLEQRNTIAGDVVAEVESIRKEVQSLTSSVNFYSTEFNKLKIELTENIKKTEIVNRQSLATLAQAEKSKEEYQSSKSNYDELVCELFNLFSQIRESIVLREQPTEMTNSERGTAAENKRYSEKDVKSKEGSNSKSESYKKLSAYQSFIQRPSSILHGLASKSHLFSLGDKDSQKTSKQKRDSKILTRSDKSVSQSSKTPNIKKKKTKGNHNNLANSPKPNEKILETKTKLGTMQSSKRTVDDIPMMDASVHPDETLIQSKNSPKIKTGISHVSINVQSPAINVGICSNEKNVSKNNQLNKGQIRNSETNIINSLKGHSSPPVSRVSIFQNNPPSSSPLLKNNLNYVTPQDNSRLQNLFRQSSVPENNDYLAKNSINSNTRYSIMRQSSSPNLPIKRQCSNSSFPIIRQNSLGIVPEEVISRQSSLLSVPEERLIVDQTIPGSLSGSVASFQLTPSSSGVMKDFNKVNEQTESRRELVITSSSDQFLNSRQLPSASEFYLGIDNATTSSLKKKPKISRINMQI